MASLRKDPRGFSKYWYACITVPGKGQTQRCTKVLATERNRGEALTVAERWEREAKHLGPAIHLENRAAVFEAIVSFTQKTITGEATEADARDVLDRLLESTGQNAIKNESARVFSERWLKAQIVGLAETSILSYNLAVRLFLEHLGPMADKPLRAVRPEQIETFKTARIGTGLTAKTVDRDLKVILPWGWLIVSAAQSKTRGPLVPAATLISAQALAGTWVLTVLTRCWPKPKPDTLLARDGQDVGLPGFLQGGECRRCTVGLGGDVDVGQRDRAAVGGIHAVAGAQGGGDRAPVHGDRRPRAGGKEAVAADRVGGDAAARALDGDRSDGRTVARQHPDVEAVLAASRRVRGSAGLVGRDVARDGQRPAPVHINARLIGGRTRLG